MSIRVLVNDHPHRTLALTTDTHSLLFKHTHTPTPHQGGGNATSLPLPGGARKASTPRCMVEFASKASLDLKGFRTLTTAKGTLGLITLNNDVFICVVTGSSEVATVRPNETVQRIFAVEFYCLNRSDYDHGQGFGPNPYPGQSFSSDDMSYGSGYEQGETIAEHPFHALKKLFSGGSFYYSLNFDLTRRLQDRIDNHDTVDIASLNKGLLWNSYMINPLISFRSRLSSHEKDALDKSGMLTSVMRGFAQTLNIPPSSSPIKRKLSNYPATLTVISRLSSQRAGTRFNSRGLDDNGNVANFVETETIFWSPTGLCFSYIQVRGSIPIFWESSSSLIPGQQKIQIIRSSEATQPSFDKHFERLEKTYGSIHIVNLLSDTKPGEADLSSRYRYHIGKSSLRRQAPDESDNHDLLRLTEFDFHEYARNAGGFEGAKELRPFIEASADSFVYFLSEQIEEEVVMDGKIRAVERPIVIMQQTGSFRVNCLDCLDRTNVVQGLISQMVLELFLDHRGERGNSVFWLRHSSLWADNGDSLSKIYAGTGALKSSFTRHGKMSLGGLMADARKSATRLYVNHFEDKDRQNTVDLLLGKLVGQDEVELYDPVNDWVLNELMKKRDEYESSEPIKAWVGTYNLNGRVMRDIEELKRWLPAVGTGGSEDFDIVAVAFQEIVELSPQQIMSTDPGRRVIWENAVKKCLNSGDTHEPETEEGYILLRSGQLVGATLMIFVKASVLQQIKNVEGAIKKTGMSGMAGNKGAVAIRMDIEGSSVCFVTAHLAAGFGNYEERNKDYTTISSGLRFQRDRSIEDHDVVIWAGDFNYRIGLNNDRARNLVTMAQKGMAYDSKSGQMELSSQSEEVLGQLYENDQLNIQMVVGHCFQFYHEGKVRFLPTYKFDLGKDDYDTGEKARIPAWTDRILWKTRPGAGAVRQLAYNSVMTVRFSDHKPVFATFEIIIKKIDRKTKAALTQKLYEKRQRDIRNRADGGGIGGEDDDISGFDDSEEDAEDLMGYQSIQEGLPPASSDRRKWWLDGDKPVRSDIKPARTTMILNERRSGNPWRENGEEDWIEVERSSATARNGYDDGATLRPQPPPPRRKKVSDSAIGSTTPLPVDKELGRVTPVSTGLPKSPPALPPPRRTPTVGSLNGDLQRSASVASVTSTATMVTARSSSSYRESDKVPPPKPSKPLALRTGSSPSSTAPTTIPRKPVQSPKGSITSPGSSKDTDDMSPPPLPQRTNTSSSMISSTGPPTANSESISKKTPPAVQPRGFAKLQQRPPTSPDRDRGVTNARAEQPTAADSDGRQTKPNLPPRTVNVMDNDEEKELQETMGRWKALSPGR